MNIYWLNPPLSTRSLHCDLGWMNFSTALPNHNWIKPIIDWEQYKTIEDVLRDIEKQPVDILMISNYAWNHKLCGKVAAIIKQEHPDVIIVSGGPNQFNIPEYVDYMCYVMAHGEIFLKELFKQLEKHRKVIAPDFVPYLITKNFKSTITTMKYEFPNRSIIREKIDYVSEVVACAKRNNKVSILLYETSRGCPYSCTYCEWGAGGTSAKLSVKPLECILEDIELASILGIRELDLIDPNFGILKRDVEIVKKISECKNMYGFPNNMTLYGLTKNSKKNKEKILDVIFEAGLMKFYFMAVQSTDKKILENVKRTDIPLNENIELAEKYKKLYNSSAKVELIMGIPGETLDTFYKEFDLFQKIGNWEIPRNLLSLLPNTEAYTQEYRDKYKIKTVMCGTMENEEQDVTYFSNSVINQFRSSFEMVVETYSYSKEDYKEMFFMNRAQRVIGETVKGQASVEMRSWFNKVKCEEWYKPIDAFLTRMVNGELHDKEITVIGNKTIEEIVAENVKLVDS